MTHRELCNLLDEAQPNWRELFDDATSAALELCLIDEPPILCEACDAGEHQHCYGVIGLDCECGCMGPYGGNHFDIELEGNTDDWNTEQQIDDALDRRAFPEDYE